MLARLLAHGSPHHQYQQSAAGGQCQPDAGYPPQGGEAPQETADQHQLAAGEQGGDAGPVDGLEVGGPTSSSPSIGKPQK